MSHFAKVVGSVVETVIVAERDYIDTLDDKHLWVQTSYNTRGGVHYGPDGTPDGGVALRKNYAGVGYTYDANLDAFIPPKPFSSWVLNTDTCWWVPPIPFPSDDGIAYTWDEENKGWVPVE